MPKQRMQLPAMSKTSSSTSEPLESKKTSAGLKKIRLNKKQADSNCQRSIGESLQNLKSRNEGVNVRAQKNGETVILNRKKEKSLSPKRKKSAVQSKSLSMPASKNEKDAISVQQKGFSFDDSCKVLLGESGKPMTRLRRKGLIHAAMIREENKTSERDTKAKKVLKASIVRSSQDKDKDYSESKVGKRRGVYSKKQKIEECQNDKHDFLLNTKTNIKKESDLAEGCLGFESESVAKSHISGKLIGAHCSIAGGLHKAVEEAVSMGARAFGLFLKSQRSWTAKPLDSVVAAKFKEACTLHNFSPSSILPHGSYLLNCGSPNPETLHKSREALLDELQRCEALGLTLFNFHPGSTCGEISVGDCLDKIADCINWAHDQTKFVVTVIENMSCQGNTVGGHFEELKGIIDRVKDKSRIGVCLDTCHAFAAGFDLSTEKGYTQFVCNFDKIVGMKYLKAMHLNDSKGAVGCHLDRHENIGKGKIGLEGFKRFMVDPKFDGIPMILETPWGNYSEEIKLLNHMAASACK